MTLFTEGRLQAYSKIFFEEHRDVLTLRRATKKAFDEYLAAHPDQKSLPRVKELNAEYPAAERRALQFLSCVLLLPFLNGVLGGFAP